MIVVWNKQNYLTGTGFKHYQKEDENNQRDLLNVNCNSLSSSLNNLTVVCNENKNSTNIWDFKILLNKELRENIKEDLELFFLIWQQFYNL